MNEIIKRIILGICYGFCAMLLMKGGFVKPLVLSQILGIVVAVLCVRKVIKEIPQIWTAVGFVAGGIIMFFINNLS